MSETDSKNLILFLQAVKRHQYSAAVGRGGGRGKEGGGRGASVDWKKERRKEERKG